MNGKTQYEKDLEKDLKDLEFAKEFYLGLGAIREQQRIIALLKNSRKKPPFKLAEVDSRHRWRNYHDMFIALIKGEEA